MEILVQQDTNYTKCMNVFTSNIESIEQQTTPFYLYDMGLLRRTLNAVKKASIDFGYQVHYAIKANSDPILLQEICTYGFGADCVSGAEISHALQVGFDPRKIVFAGVGKRDEEIILAIENNIHSLNIESLHELEVVGEWSEKLQKRVQLAMRIIPEVNANTHAHITTGTLENKFGISFSDIPKVRDILVRYSFLQWKGIHLHVGSQVLDMEVYKELCIKASELWKCIESYGIDLEFVNLGGGLGIRYDAPDTYPIADFHSFFQNVKENLKIPSKIKIHFELGRSVVGQCGSLICKVLYIKETATKTFLILDGGMTELLRPALYGAQHQIDNISSQNPLQRIYEVVGPICESSDCFGKNISLPISSRGDLMVIRSAGAYGEVMASRYNMRVLHPSLYLDS